MCNAHDHHHGHSAEGAAPRLVDLSKMPRRDLVRGLASGAILVAGGSALAGCATNRETGRSQFMLVDDGMLASMALDAWQEEKSKTPISRDRVANERLRRVGERVALAANRPNDPWEFVVFDKPEKNAFVLPGGKVGFYRGLIDISDRDDHIACVLGHEVGHVTGRHAAERFSLQMGGQLALLGAGMAAGDMDPQTRGIAMQALGLGLTFGVILPYSRNHESEADKLGLNYMYNAGYQPRQAITFWQRMSADNRGARPPEFLSTHPDPETRIRDIEAHINNMGW
jgi:predicted Zn-dependent protease